MAKQVTFTDLEWEFVQQKVHEAIQSMPASYTQGEQFSLGGRALANLAAATTVPDSTLDPTTQTGGVFSQGDQAGIPQDFVAVVEAL
jgi:hypothetical protein